MKNIFIVSLTVILITAACSPVAAPQEKQCGDGICTSPENSSLCPADCPAESVPSSSQGTSQSQSNTGKSNTSLMIGFMVHLEGWNDDMNQAKFNEHAQIVREYADLFERYGAKITFESKELTDGSIKWKDNVLLEMQQRGHGVGVHADEGGDRDYDECQGFTEALLREKTQLESLGVNVLHVSGVVSKCDWVTATAQAGFKFTTGTVSYAAMSLSPDLKPAEYSNCPNPSRCHDVFPTELEGRIHPWTAENGSNWILDDPNGQLVILAASQGLTCVEEELSPSGKTGSCVFNQGDINAYIEQLNLALSLAEPGKVNIFYVGNSLGAKLDMNILEAWLKAIDPYVKNGQVQWATLPEIYQAYAASK
jgi:hypothetical protein